MHSSTLSAALADIIDGFRRWRVWTTLAREDIFDQHKRTVLGPFWLLINYLCFAGTFVLLFGGDKDDAGVYATYVASGLLIWMFISEIISGSVGLISREQALVKGTTLPFSVYIFKFVTQSTIRLLYASIGCIIILIATGHSFQVYNILVIASVVFIVVISPAIVAIFAIAGAYFPDLNFVVVNAVRLGIFLTPIFWYPEEDGSFRSLLYKYNPLSYFIDIVRSPLIYGYISYTTIAFCLCTGILAWFAALVIIGQFRDKLVYTL